MAEQLSFDLPVRAALGREDFFVSPANAEAVAMVEGWQGWPSRKLVLTGPAGAGKTHLAHVWAGLAGAGSSPRAIWPAATSRDWPGPRGGRGRDAVAGDRAPRPRFSTCTT